MLQELTAYFDRGRLVRRISAAEPYSQQEKKKAAEALKAADPHKKAIDTWRRGG